MLNWSRPFRPIASPGKNRFAVDPSPHVQMKTKPQYVEGPQAQTNFERNLTALFKVPKDAIGKPRKPAKKRKSKHPDKD